MTAPIRIDQIADRWWAPRLNAPGEIVANVDDINQCLSIIFNTPKGSDPHRPNFACDLSDLIDLPVNVIAERIPVALIEAATLWEPRIDIIGVPVNIDGPHVSYTALWRLKGGGDIQALAGTIGGGAR